MLAALFAWLTGVRPPARRHAARAAGRGDIQGLLGMWTVTLLLKHSSSWAPAWRACHAGPAGMVCWRTGAERRPATARDGGAGGCGTAGADRPDSARRLDELELCRVGLPDLPTCQGQWPEEADFSEGFVLWRGLGVNYEFGVRTRPRGWRSLHTPPRRAADARRPNKRCLWARRGRSRRASAVATSLVLVAVLLQVAIASDRLVRLPLPGHRPQRRRGHAAPRDDQSPAQHRPAGSAPGSRGALARVAKRAVVAAALFARASSPGCSRPQRRSGARAAERGGARRKLATSAVSTAAISRRWTPGSGASRPPLRISNGTNSSRPSRLGAWT